MVSFADRMSGIKASDIRQLLAVASKPEIISFAGAEINRYVHVFLLIISSFQR